MENIEQTEIEKLPDFTKKVIDFHSQELKDRTYQFPASLKEQLEDLALLFVKKSERARRERSLSDELKAQFNGRGFFDFIKELMGKSYGYRFNYSCKGSESGRELKEKEFVQVDVSLPHLPHNLSIFDLLRIAEQYQAPKTKFKPEAVPVKEGEGEEISLNLQAAFEEQALSLVFDRRFEEIELCTKNKRSHSLAEYQDAADPFTHRFRVTAELVGRSRGLEEVMSSSLLEAIVIECRGEKDKKQLLLEGVHGSVGEKEKEKVFDYLYACLIDHAYQTKSNLLFNLSFNPKSQPEPIEFVNYVSRRILKRELYRRKNGKFLLPKEVRREMEKYRREIRAATLKDSSERVEKVRKDLEEGLERIFKDPNRVLDDFCQERRYTDTWQPYELEVRRNKDKPQWNMREGEAYCLELNGEEVKEEYQRLLSKREEKSITEIKREMLKKYSYEGDPQQEITKVLDERFNEEESPEKGEERVRLIAGIFARQKCVDTLFKYRFSPNSSMVVRSLAYSDIYMNGLAQEKEFDPEEFYLTAGEICEAYALPQATKFVENYLQSEMALAVIPMTVTGKGIDDTEKFMEITNTEEVAEWLLEEPTKTDDRLLSIAKQLSLPKQEIIGNVLSGRQNF